MTLRARQQGRDCERRPDRSFEDAVKVTRWEDHTPLAGRTYRYYVRPCAATGQGGVPSNTVFVDLPRPAYMPKAAAMAATSV